MCLLCTSLAVFSQEEQEHEPIARLKQLVDYPDNERNSRPLYEEIAELITNGDYSLEDVQNGARVPQFEEIAKCGVYEPPPLEQHFTMKDGALIGSADLDSSSRYFIPCIRWARGLRARLEQVEAEGDAERSWEEIRQALVVGLQIYEANAYMTDRLVGIAVLRLAVQNALTSGIPRLVENRALLEQVLETCKRQRLLAEEISADRRAIDISVHLADRGGKKIIHDYLDLMQKALSFKDHPYGEAYFILSVYYANTAGIDECWDILFATLHRFADAKNAFVRRSAQEILQNYDREDLPSHGAAR